jgi:hypothetical protein
MTPLGFPVVPEVYKDEKHILGVHGLGIAEGLVDGQPSGRDTSNRARLP